MTFDALYEAERGHVLALASRIVRNRALAEDVAQDTWLKVARFLHTFNGQSKPSAWVYRIAFNTALDHLRRTQPLAPLPEDFDAPHGGPSPLDAFLADETTRRVRRAIASLPPIHRDVLHLSLSGVPVRDGAFLLGIPCETFKSRTHRARAALLARWR